MQITQRLIFKFFFSFLFLIFSFYNIQGQDFTQNIRGRILDKQSQNPLPGANVIVLNTNPSIGASSDANGYFKIPNVPVGRISVQISFIGYKPLNFNNIELSSAKELILNVELEEQVFTSKEVVITAEKDRTKANNEMTTVSARTFSVEESQRFAGARNDVARMAQNFAGVQGADDSRNDIVIRGNTPIGLLYRMEGIDIPNPNHFAVLGTTGGPVSLLNNNVLSNSDFMTGAFPAEYGNAISGVFDLKMRAGNDEKHEFLGQIGFNGAELLAEGPLSKKSKASYLISYRYSILSIFQALGIDFGTTALPEYQDISFKLNFPRKKGTTSIFGIGGISDIVFRDSERDPDNDLFSEAGEDLVFGSNVGLIGVSHSHILNKSTYIKLVTAFSGNQNEVDLDSITPTDRNKIDFFGQNSTESKIATNLFLNKKINARHNFKIGIIAERRAFNLNDSVFRASLNQFITLNDFDGSALLIQPYAQWQFRISDKLTLNSGLHYQYLELNKTNAFEPRVGFSWQANENNRFSLAYGLHSQVLPSTIYFEQERNPVNGTYSNLNMDLPMMKSHHIVLAYDRNLNNNARLKIETYYQSLYDIPINISPNNLGTYSLLNQGANFGIAFPDTISSDGTGINYGIELTLEKFMTKGFYFLLTTSLFDSKYVGSNGKEFNTAFAGNYTFNMIGGKEFNVFKGGKKKNKITTDFKVVSNGGQRYTPILLEESRLAGRAVYDEENAFSEKNPAYFRFDLRIGFKRSGKKVSQEWVMDIQNVLNYQNVFQRTFNATAGEIQTSYQIGLLPIMQYRIQF